MLLLPHFIILWVLSDKTYLELYRNTSAGRLSVCFRILLVFLYIITFCLLHIMPFISRKDRKSMSLRVKIMYGGRRILKFCFQGILAQLFVYLMRLPSLVAPADVSWPLVMIVDGIFVFLHFYLLVLNGYIRILCTCRSLGIWKRILIFCFLWFPVFHLLPARYLMKRAYEEYDAERCRFENRLSRPDAPCATR